MNLLEDKNNPLWESKNVIYCYTNKINGKKYVGQTIQTLKERHRKHISPTNNNDKNSIFHNAIKKHGIENFTLEILHFADVYSINLLEIYYIEHLNLLDRKTGYNISNGGSNGNPFVGKTKEEIDEIHNKISQTLTGKYVGENHPLYGKHHTEETKEKISKNRKGKNCGKDNPSFGIHKSDETKNKISETLKGKYTKEKSSRYNKGIPIALYKNNELIKIFYGGTMQAERETGVNHSNISGCCKGRYKSAGKFEDGTKMIWRYYKE